jgi:hypothetical protein
MRSIASRAGSCRRARAAGVLAILAIALGAVAPAALAAPPAPAWEISSVAHPTNFSIEDNEKCQRTSQPLCDQYLVTLTNVGAGETNGAVTIVDTLPQGLRPVGHGGVFVRNLETEEQVGCSVLPFVSCVYGGAVKPGATLAVFVELEVEPNAPAGPVTNSVSVSGGGAPAASTSTPLTLPNTVDGSPAAFGISAFGFAAHDASGLLDTQAGDHPYSITNTVNLNTVLENHPSENTPLAIGSVEVPRDFVVYLPLGFLGDPLAAARCTELQLKAQGGASETECPPASRVGQVMLFVNAGVSSSANPHPPAATGTSVYDMVPDAGYVAEFGLKTNDLAVSLYASVVHTPVGYAVRVALPGVPHAIRSEGATFTFFGDPRTADGEPSSSQAFFTNPSDCSGGPVTAKAQVDSWTHPGRWVTGEAVSYPTITGCNLLQFEPTVEVRPEVTEAEEPTGVKVKIKVPQTPEKLPVLATPQLKNVTMTFPEGMTISPGGGDGLVGCQATGAEGIDMPANLPEGRIRTPTEAGEGEEIGADGMTHLTAGHCPPASQIGTVRISTPVLEAPLEGHLYVAQPKCGGSGQPPCTSADATNGNLFGLYLEAGDPGSGIVVKLAGSASVNPATGRITARFTENPQFPVSEVTLHLKGGERASLANPRQCGEAVTNADLTPWSSPITPDAVTTSGYPVTWDGGSAPCPGTLPFAPALTAGTITPTAGRFSPFTLTIARGDRQQDLSRLQVSTPPGLLGMLSQVPLCGEPEAAAGTCPESTRVGTVHVAAGSGPHPLWETGRAFLTTGYRGAPFGLTVVVPAVAGPFNLGNVVVRSRIDINPSTSALTVTSDPLPQFRDGVPLRIQTLNVAVDRPGFMFNPTNCGAKRVSATLEAVQGASTTVSTPFAVEGCRNLPLKPSFKVSTQGNGTFGGGAKGKGASLDVKVAQAPGEAAIGKVDVQLPLALPSRLTTLQQACTEAQFASNPAGCPAGSNVGFAKATTPVLKVPLTGPAYLVSHGGAAFPDLVVVLQGNERGGHIRIDVIGNTNIKKGITYSNFDTVPDAPISSFELTLPEGPHSVLAAIKNLCAVTKTVTVKSHGKRVKRTVPDPLLMPTTITGQNGAVVKQSTKITVTGCAAHAARRTVRLGKARKGRKR